MSSKISALPAAADIANADVVAGLRSGVNVKIDRPTYLTAKAGEAIALNSIVGKVEIDAAGRVTLLFTLGQLFQIKDSALVTYIEVGPTGTLNFQVPNGQSIDLTGSLGGQILIDPSGVVTINCAGGVSAEIDYFPATPGDWVGGNPVEMHIAIDRIAAAVAGLLGGPIP